MSVHVKAVQREGNALSDFPQQQACCRSDGCQVGRIHPGVCKDILHANPDALIARLLLEEHMLGAELRDEALEVL